MKKKIRYTYTLNTSAREPFRCMKNTKTCFIDIIFSFNNFWSNFLLWYTDIFSFLDSYDGLHASFAM